MRYIIRGVQTSACMLHTCSTHASRMHGLITNPRLTDGMVHPKVELFDVDGKAATEVTRPGDIEGLPGLKELVPSCKTDGNGPPDSASE